MSAYIPISLVWGAIKKVDYGAWSWFTLFRDVDGGEGAGKGAENAQLIN